MKVTHITTAYDNNVTQAEGIDDVVTLFRAQKLKFNS